MIASDYPEGATRLDPNELAGLKYRHITTQAELDELEQANITSGLLWLSRTRRKDILTDGFAIELHRRLFREVWNWAGTFRTTGKNIGVDPMQIGVVSQFEIEPVARGAKKHVHLIRCLPTRNVG